MAKEESEKSRDSRGRTAAARARERLINAHLPEYLQYLRAERVALGLPADPTSKTSQEQYDKALEKLMEKAKARGMKITITEQKA